MPHKTTHESTTGDVLLLIEDDAATASAMARLMKSVAVSVRCVGTIREGIAALRELPAVVVLDLMLSDGCGVEVLEAIRAAKLRCKVAIVSASTDAATFERLRVARPDAVFPKPLDFQDFVDWLCEAFPEPRTCDIAA
jgi:DNA-binding NarL/FixJ family response regulator